jgi:hypothetical protein
MTQARKRKRGRPPGKSIRKKSAVFSTRITPETRALLEKATQASGKSYSQVFQELFEDKIRPGVVQDLKSRWGSNRSGLDKQPDHVQALAVLVAMLTENIEATTGLSWRADQRVCQAIMGGLEAMFAALRHGASIPTSLDETVPWVRSIIADRESAQYYGALEACKLLRALPPEGSSDNAPLAWVREKLGIQSPPRDWSELVRVAQEELEAVTEPKDEEKKS